ncbi:MAG TPA: hypothetical protein VGA13_08490, partial [Acidimicrobiales bacterium]
MIDDATDLAELARRFRHSARWALHGAEVDIPAMVDDPAHDIDRLDTALADDHEGRRHYAWRSTLAGGASTGRNPG